MSPTGSRQQRIDFLRGLALLVIFVDHLEFVAGAALLSPWTLRGWYWCDAAEVFVFLSGLVCGWTYLRTLERDGFSACRRKGFRRAFRIYLANLACLAIIVELVIFFGPPDAGYFARLQYAGIGQHLAHVASMSAAMLYQPTAVDILTLYIQFVALLPFMLACWRRWPIATKCACLGVYVSAQWLECVNIPRWPTDVFVHFGCGRHFHHAAWNCLFFLAVLAAIDPIRIRSRTARRVLFWTCLTGVVAVVLSTQPSIAQHVAGLQQLRDWRDSAWGHKVTLGPARLIPFLMLAYVVSIVLTEQRFQRIERFVRPVTRLGRNSLLVFCVGLLFTHASWLVLPKTTDAQRTSTILLYEILACGLMLLAASAWEHFVRRSLPAERSKEDSSSDAVESDKPDMRPSLAAKSSTPTPNSRQSGV